LALAAAFLGLLAFLGLAPPAFLAGDFFALEGDFFALGVFGFLAGLLAAWSPPAAPASSLMGDSLAFFGVAFFLAAVLGFFVGDFFPLAGLFFAPVFFLAGDLAALGLRALAGDLAGDAGAAAAASVDSSFTGDLGDLGGDGERARGLAALFFPAAFFAGDLLAGFRGLLVAVFLGVFLVTRPLAGALALVAFAAAFAPVFTIFLMIKRHSSNLDR